MSRLRSRFGLLLPALAGLVLLIAACEDDNDAFDDTLGDPAGTPTPAATPTPVVDDDDDDATPAPTPEPADPEPTDEIRADFEEVDGSGVTGELEVVAYNSASEVTVTLEGLETDRDYTFQIRSGSCGDEETTLAFPLGAIEVDEDGSAEATGELEVGFALIRGNHVTIEAGVDDEEAPQGDVVACADIDDNGTDDGLFDDDEDDEEDDGLD